jgi:MSHA biogenesis protein MshJ
LNALSQRWQVWSERIDAMALRERVMVFFAIAVVVLSVLYYLVSKPVLEKQRIASKDIAQKQVDTRVLQDEVQKILGHRTDDPDAARRAQVEQLRARVAALDARLSDKQRELVSPDRVTALLEEMLRRDRKLDLVGLHSMPPVALFDEKVADPNNVNASNAPRLQVYRHGVELTVRGTYFDLLNYLGELERLPHRMFWHEVDISSDKYPMITMKLSIYTLSLDRSWVVV